MYLHANIFYNHFENHLDKILSYLLPALIHSRAQRGGPNVLVIAPTTELCEQIEEEFEKYRFPGMKAVCVVGGNDRQTQIKQIQRGAKIIIGEILTFTDRILTNCLLH